MARAREHLPDASPLVLPTWEETRQILRDSEKNDPDITQAEMQSTVAKWIWEKNKDKHPFFVEESYPLKWSYDNAIPRGLVYEIAPEKLDSLPREAVEKDFAFWNAYIPPLIKDPKFLDRFRCAAGILQAARDCGEHLQAPQHGRCGEAGVPAIARVVSDEPGGNH